jgi:hypothetical protein
MDDSFMRDYIDDLLKNIRTQVLLKLLTPYSKIRIGFLATVSCSPHYVFVNGWQLMSSFTDTVKNTKLKTLQSSV